MTKALFIFLILPLIIFCKEDKVMPKAILKIDTSQVGKQNLSLDKITFDFSAKKDNKNKNYVDISATLSNQNIDTIYLFTWTDHGKQYSLRYDTSKFDYRPESVFNATYPIVEKISPGGHINFTASFFTKKKVNKIKLDYDFFRIEKPANIDLRNMDFNKILRFEQNRRKTILYGPEKAIE